MGLYGLEQGYLYLLREITWRPGKLKAINLGQINIKIKILNSASNVITSLK
jgi:hypothetical protein